MNDTSAETESPERVQAILEQRARELARVPARPPDASEMLQVLTFAIGTERLALETCYVRRVLSRWQATPVPGGPEALVGVTNLHGEVLALFDPRVLLGMPRADAAGAAHAHVLVLGEERDELGLVTDGAGDVRALRIAELLATPAPVEGLGQANVRGVTEDALVVLDGRALLVDDRLVVYQADEPGA